MKREQGARTMHRNLALIGLALTFAIIMGTALVTANVNNAVHVDVYIWPRILTKDSYNCYHRYGFNEWVIAFIQLPTEYTTQNVDMTSITLHANGGSVPASNTYAIWKRTIIAKFDRTDVTNIIKASIEHMTPYPIQKMTLTVTGNLHDGNTFRGQDTITVFFTNN